MTFRALKLLLILSLSAGAWSCGSSDSPTAPSPPAADFGAQFDSLWSTFDREYSYFDYKQIDWNALKALYRPMAVAAPDQVGFIGVIREMLGRLHDLHVVVRDPGGASLATYVPDVFVNWDRSVWQQYIAIGGWNSTSLRADDFDAALERFRTAPALIVDVRMNPGGNDQLAFDVAGRFARSAVNTGFVKFRNGPAHSDFGAAMPRVLNPRGAWQYSGAVQLLIGRRCASSNESFIAAMRELPNVTLVGDRTAGASANPGTFPLANGWTYTVSRWIEYTADNQVIEDAGIAPRVLVAASASDFAQGRDPVLEFALHRFSAADHIMPGARAGH